MSEETATTQRASDSGGGTPESASPNWTDLIPAILSLPFFAWVLLDRTPFAGDQAQYARATIELFSALRQSPDEWLPAVLGAFPTKPNGIIWTGLPFVPIGILIGSIDTALLLSVAACAALVLLLLHRSIRALAPRSRWPALVGCLVVASSPLFHSMAREYLVEILQTLSVAWFLLIMSRAREWSRALVFGQLVAATAFALASKQIQPLFCLWPGLVAVYVSNARAGREPSVPRPRAASLTFVLGIALLAITLIWYVHNFEAVTSHLRAGAFSPALTLYWGKDDSYLNTVAYWFQAMGDSFFLGGLWLLVVALLATALFTHVSRRAQMDWFAVCAAASALQILTVVLVFSISPTRQVRYLLPALPCLGLVVGWCVATIENKWIVRGAIATFALSLVVIEAHAFGVARSTSWWLPAMDTAGHYGKPLEAIVARTCTPEPAGRSHNVLAIDTAFPDLIRERLGPEEANYVATRNAFLRATRPGCEYGYAGDGFFGSSVDDAWKRLLDRNTRYVITIDPEKFSIPTLTFNKTLSRENHSAFLERIRQSGRFEEEPPLAENSGILIFQRISTDATTAFYGRLWMTSLGDGSGAVERRAHGILIHPGQTRATSATFRLDAGFRSLTLRPFIATLPAPALRIPAAGTVNVEMLVDGVSRFHSFVDRHSTVQWTVDVQGVRDVTLRVDNADGTPWWDWLIVTVVEAQPARSTP
jgi:hypothetical protein